MIGHGGLHTPAMATLHLSGHCNTQTLLKKVLHDFPQWPVNQSHKVINMALARKNFEKLQRIGIVNKNGCLTFDEHLKLKSGAYMDLSLNWLFEDDQYQYFAMTHYGELNGDLMSDPDMEVRVDAIKGTAEALSYRNDWVGVNNGI